MAIDDRMTDEALALAKTHIYNVTQQGATVTLVKPGTKDEYGTILTETTLDLKVHPTRFTPFSRELVQKISWTENVDVIFFASKKQIDNLSLTIAHIKQYINIKYKSKKYELRYVDEYSSFGDDCLYVILGAKI